MKNKFQTDWLEVAKTDDATCLCKVPDLKERMVYQFRVRAQNKAGQSKPSEPTDNHLCKHKNRKYTRLLMVALQFRQGFKISIFFSSCEFFLCLLKFSIYLCTQILCVCSSQSVSSLYSYVKYCSFNQRNLLVCNFL